ncbi:WD40 repeat-like protein [Cristinia sonorae]|uniref:WD40 repeat-like protein n=1 Tax=Cristinia sonorae TaxID=1940300 RepID=A0A8K0XTI7_9AGAR|nr:WD40 repeat-like protein [Cristinia sonorae]
MVVPQPRRRLSYVIPSPADPPPRLQLPPHGYPRNGSIGPIITPLRSDDVHAHVQPRRPNHPRHRLGVACLALDTSTQLVGRANPEGILYSGGRDGLVISWDLGVPMKRRSKRYGVSTDSLRRSTGRWEVMTGWADDVPDDDFDEDEGKSDGDILGEAKPNGSRRRRRNAGPESDIPYEEQWETDTSAFQEGTTSRFRQSAQMHSDWVNDIILTNHNQTVVTASSDGTVRTWNPHVISEPTIVGQHADYVRCLTYCREQNWIASGSFDRTVKLWDLANVPSPKQDPLITLQAPEASGPKASIYALASDPFGNIIATGSPERVIRMWDPRSGKRIGKLVGHTDNIRAILVSEDSRYLLTGSADASIKLWSLSSQRCLHTFTHHTESVWSLFSNHPSLESFYSGDRSGLVCKVDVENCSDVSEGECVVLCQESNDRCSSSHEGISKIVAMDDNLLWTASGNSSIRRWKVPGPRSVRASVYATGETVDSPSSSELPLLYNSIKRRSLDGTHPRTSPSPTRQGNGLRASHTPSLSGSHLSEGVASLHDKEGEETWYGIPFESLVRLTSPNETFTTFGMLRGRDPEIATLYSAASVMSIPRVVRSPLQTLFHHAQMQRSSSPMPGDTTTSKAEETVHPSKIARQEYLEREVAADAVPLYSTPDEVIQGDSGLVRCAILNDRMRALTVDTAGSVAVWDILRGSCLGMFSSEDVSAASFRGSTASDGSGEREHSPREALETVRERIEGEAVVMPWATVDTKTGVLTVHLNEKCFDAEIYADEAGYPSDRQFSDEIRLNLGKWLLRNIFLGFIKEQQRMVARRNHDNNHRINRPTAPTHIDTTHRGHSPESSRRSSSDVSRTTIPAPRSASIVTSPNIIPAVTPSVNRSTKSSPLLTPMIPISLVQRDSLLSPIPQSPGSTDATPLARPHRAYATEGSASTAAGGKDGDYFSLRSRQPASTSGTTPDDFSGWGGPNAKPTPAAETPTAAQPTPTPSTPGTSFMNRFKVFGSKSGKRNANDVGTSNAGSAQAEGATSAANAVTSPAPKTPLQHLLAEPITPPSSSEAPTLPIPPDTSIIISEEAMSGWTTIYRGHVSDTSHDVRVLEETMPVWLLEYLLANKTPSIPIVKISFILLPYAAREGEEQLPELLNTSQAKLTASRFLRVKKLTYHVQDKLDKLSAAGRTPAQGTPRSSVDSRSVSPHTVRSRSPSKADREGRPRAEEVFEILCNDMVLPLNMTLAAVRQFVWRSAGELTMHYRKKAVPQ